MNKLTLHRVYLEEATHGLLQFNGHHVCFSLELPWLDNQAYISCIPEGTYPLAHRYSERFKLHLEVKKVPDRHLILFHPANHVKLELQGCIAPVSQIMSPVWGHRSRLAMNRLLDYIGYLIKEQTVELIIQKASEDDIIQLIKKGKL